MLSKICNIIHCQFLRSSLKGNDNAMNNFEDKYKVSLESCKMES